MLSHSAHLWQLVRCARLYKKGATVNGTRVGTRMYHFVCTCSCSDEQIDTLTIWLNITYNSNGVVRMFYVVVMPTTVRYGLVSFSIDYVVRCHLRAPHIVPYRFALGCARRVRLRMCQAAYLTFFLLLLRFSFTLSLSVSVGVWNTNADWSANKAETTALTAATANTEFLILTFVRPYEFLRFKFHSPYIHRHYTCVHHFIRMEMDECKSESFWLKGSAQPSISCKKFSSIFYGLIWVRIWMRATCMGDIWFVIISTTEKNEKKIDDSFFSCFEWRMMFSQLARFAPRWPKNWFPFNRKRKSRQDQYCTMMYMRRRGSCAQSRQRITINFHSKHQKDDWTMRWQHRQRRRRQQQFQNDALHLRMMWRESVGIVANGFDEKDCEWAARKWISFHSLGIWNKKKMNEMSQRHFPNTRSRIPH